MTNNSDVKASGVVKLPENLQNLPRAEYFPTQRHRWNTNEEIASVLICLEKHQEWLSKEVKIRPKSGSMLLYSRKKVRYRRDGYCWKKRKDGKTTREDHMKLKVQGVECIYGCYVHSAILPTFHRRCYWLLQNPDIVLVHYLNVPYTEDNKVNIVPCLSYCVDKKEWSKDELVSQLKPMFYSENEPDLNNELEISTAETIDAIVQQLIEKQRARAKACLKEYPCEDSNKTGQCENRKCAQVSPRVISPKTDSAIPSLPRNESLVPATITSHSNSQNTSSLIITTNTPSGISSSMHISATSNSPVILGLSQLHNGSGLLILNSTPTNSSTTTTNTISIPWMPISVTEGTKVNAVPIVCEPSKVIDQSAQILIPVEKDDDLSIKVKEELLENIPTTQANLPEVPSIQELNHKNETQSLGDDILDLSQDDIQKTLSANMPQSQISQKLCDSSDLNPMDFIDNDIPTSDDFVNLEAFDMLADFADLETINTDLGNSMDYHPTSGSTPSSPGKKSNNTGELTSNVNNNNNNNSPLNITDFSPEWAYPEGGMKVLVTGPWYSASSYNCLFDGISVHASLVQSGVLRCYCPAHEAGLVSLQVACDGCLISDSVIFEYKARPHSMKLDNLEDWLTPDENDFNMAILERLEQMEKKLSAGGSNPHESSPVSSSSSRKEKSFEERLVTYCQQLSTWSWLKSDDIHPLPCYHRGLTLLHLAAALGYTKLVNTLIHWRTDNPSIILEAEVDAVTRDDKNCTPLMWACACGQTDTALLLYHWNSQALHVCNSFGQLPLTVARAHGHTGLSDQLEQLEHARISCLPLSSKPLPVSYDSGFNRSYFDRMSNTQSVSDTVFYPSLQEQDKSSPLSTEEIQYSNSPSETVLEQYPHDTRSRRSRLCKRPSVDSGRHTPSTDPSRKFTRHDDLMKDMGLRLSPILMSSPSDCSANVSPLESSFNTEVLFQEAMNEGSSEEVKLNENRGLSQERINLIMDSRLDMSDNPFIEVVVMSDDEDDVLQHRLLEKTTVNLVGSSDDPPDTRVLTLAEQIIAAIPERIKAPGYSEVLDEMGKENMDISHDSPGEMAKVEDDPILQDHDAFNFEFSDNTYRYCDVSTPNSSLSPASSCLQSPCSFTLDSPSPPPTTADFCEFFQASGKMMEKDFSQLTLSDREQRELYEAAKIIQNAYRQYKGRRKQREQEKERQAAILIQSYYRRYKQYAYFKKLTKAAVLIQNQFRTYCEHKRFKKNKEAAACIQSHCRNTSFRRRQQAARKIQQFMRQSKNNVWEYLHEQAIAERTRRKRDGATTGNSNAAGMSCCHGRSGSSILYNVDKKESRSFAKQPYLSMD